LYYRAVIMGTPVTDEFLRTLLAGVLNPVGALRQ
jgi:hypothetical protein